MSDHSLEELGGKTPLQVAEKPNMDWIASQGKSGFLKNVPKGMEANSDVAIMSIMGYNPKEHYTGRGPLEAAGMDVDLAVDDVAFRCNLITVDDGVIKDYSAGHVTTGEAEELMEVVKRNFGNIGDFFTGVDYRHLFVLRGMEGEVEELSATPPHYEVGGEVEKNLLMPRDSEVSEVLNEMMLESREILEDHPVNKKRAEEGQNLANMIWVWGGGRKPSLEPLSKKYGLSGSVISAVTLVKGLGVCAGMDKIEVPEVTGYYDTSYENKAEYGLKALEDHDLVVVHVEAPDEAGHAGDIQKKIEAIENLDSRLIDKFLDKLDGRFSISIMADHPTPIDVKNHVAEPVPFSVYSSVEEEDKVDCFDEFSVKKGAMGTLDGHKLMQKLVQLS